jgi:Flp pilus assembly protein TadD/outer membrane receptor protein involved in Fe transport
MKQVKSLLLTVVLVIVSLSFSDIALAETCNQWVAKMVSAQGTVEAKRADEKQWLPVKLNDTYCQGDMIRVLERSRAAVMLTTQPTLRLNQDTTVTFNGVEKEKTSLIDLLKGAVHFFSRYPRSLKVTTPFVNAAVEGTEFYVRVDDDKTLLSIFEGQVLASNKAGSLMLTDGQSAIAEADKVPVYYVVVRPRDAVQWALYYPPVIYRYEELKEGDPRFYTNRASSLLAVGRVEEAKAEIEKALSINPSNSQAFALQSIIAVTQNEKEKALTLAKKAAENDPKSASARIALSYAQQANFDLKDSLESLKQAVQVEPENALAWARLAELHMSFGEFDEALNAANKAVSLNPNISRTQTVLGYVYLTQVIIEEAEATFEKAVELDQADPLPRLGLGLAKIRDGDLHGGRREIEIAATLDPGNSLIRSYLGKAYYEEKRDKMSEDQYRTAKEFDPSDPTPFFYDAIRKQSINRPVEALHDMQKAIELNDNRMIYRSELMLDSDLAARSASLGRIYTDLGFQQLALVEGWKSVNYDPADFSGHRFLADSYSSLPRHEIARVSELLQSQLLQPININPVQPHLAESNLFILDGAGPADLSFNEFNPLFNRDRLALQLSGIAGGDDTFGDEVVFSGVQGRASFSVGQFHYETDGFRDNNDQRQDIYNAFVQYSISHKTSVQAEFRSRDFDRGDLTLNFFPDSFFRDLRIVDEIRSTRLGFHHAFSPNSSLIGSYVSQDFDTTVDGSIPPPPVLMLSHDKTEDDGYNAELQYMYRMEDFKVITGIGNSNIDREQTFSSEFIEPPLVFVSKEESDIRHKNLYLYSHINFLRKVILTMGGSADFFEGGIEDKDQFNPKFGLAWNLFPTTTLRAAVFRVFKRTLLTNQTVEPTQVAGFNQFFDDAEETESWRYGVALDHKFSRNIFGGIEYSQRDLKTPIYNLEDPASLEIQKVDWEERLGRVYLYWTPHSWLSLSAEYLYERFYRKEFPIAFEYLKTNRFPLGINFYHPSGFSAKLRATYFDQEGMILPQFLPPGSPTVPGNDQFWVVDGSVSYRLPKRLGLLTIGVRNLFDEDFMYQDTDPANPQIQPKRLIFARLTLAI